MVFAKGDSIHFRVLAGHFAPHSDLPRKCYLMVQQAGTHHCDQKTHKQTVVKVKSTPSLENLGMDRVNSRETLSNFDPESVPATPEAQDNISGVQVKINEQTDELVFNWNQEFNFPSIECSQHGIKFWFTLMESHTLRKDKKIAEGDCYVDGDDLSCVNVDKSIKITMKGIHNLSRPGSPTSSSATSTTLDNTSSTPDTDSHELRASSSQGNLSALREDNSISGALEASVKIVRNEHFTAALLLEETNKHTRIELGHWDGTSVISSSHPVVENSAIDEFVKGWTKRSVSKNLNILLPADWIVKKAQGVNKDQHSHYEAEFWSARCLGPETDQIEILSIVYQKVCSCTDEDYEFTKGLYENMLLHKLSHDAFNGLETIVRNEDVTSKFGASAFDSVSRYHFRFVKRIGFAEVDHLLYIFKPKGLNVMLCAFIETSFGVGENEHNLVEYAAKSATIVYQ